MSKFDHSLWNQFWAIARPYWFSEKKWAARGLLLLLLLLSLGVNGLNVGISFIWRFIDTAWLVKMQGRSGVILQFTVAFWWWAPPLSWFIAISRTNWECTGENG